MMAGPLTVRRGEAGRADELMQVLFVLAMEFALSKSDAAAQARGHEEWPSGRHDVHRAGSSDEPLMEQH